MRQNLHRPVTGHGRIQAAVLVFLGALAVPAAADHRNGPPPNQVAVICGPYTYGYQPNPNRWYWDIEPRRCDLVERNEKSYGYNTTELRSMRWPTWNRRVGLGRGKVVVNMLGKTPVRVKLYRPRGRCGHEVFTRALVKYTRLDERGRMRLNDWCL